ncbi:U5 small nuclear ribonucleoprotein TSSC4 [Bacillus rossius redtenbacheri]|uniref:U5 small nuclear ribonucleoprotein TSSC4 n=1 Tax=Bacillus rossius redtenbacheri TaxID=93214 RepID=UPI002FDD22B5
MLNTSATFFVKGGDTGFADREKRLLDCLAAAESEKNGRRDSSLNAGGEPAVGEASRPSRKRRRAETKPFRGKESIFKEPGDPPPRARARDDVPDHHRNPHRWVRYSLGDVSQEDMSDQSNTAAALSFLRELELRKELLAGGDMMDCDPPGPAPVVFKRPAQRGGDAPGCEGPADRAVFKSSKLVMPEYVVGRDKKERKSRGAQPASKYDKSKEIKLQHLQFEDDPE